MLLRLAVKLEEDRKVGMLLQLVLTQVVKDKYGTQ
jgi:hypothetical protein